MEKRESKRKQTRTWEDLYARALIGNQTLKCPVLDISIGGMGILVTNGFSYLQEGKGILIQTLEKKGVVVATDIRGRITHLGHGVPTRVGIEFSPSDTPIEAYAQLNGKDPDQGSIIVDRDEILEIFTDVQKWSRGFGDMLMIEKHKAIPAEFFYLRPNEGNMVLRIVRISDLRLPFQPQAGNSYPIYLFKGVNVMLFSSTVLDVIKNIVETSWPESLRHISRRSVLRYFVTGDEPVTGLITHPISSERIRVIVWDISIEGMGVEILAEKSPLIEGMNLPSIRINLPRGHVRTSGIVRSVRQDTVLDKTQVGIEFTGMTEQHQEKILQYILDMDLPSETIVRARSYTV
ncbi:MAG: PilZ domain-containing protein [Desulfomonilia bacterium]